MPVRIRLARIGRRNLARFRIVAADSRMQRDGRLLDTIGTYNPQSNPRKFTIDAVKMAYWLKQGAQPSETIASMLKQDRFFEKKEAMEKGLDPATLNIERLPDRKRKAKSKKKAAANASAAAA